jgi:uncharacterized protein
MEGTGMSLHMKRLVNDTRVNVAQLLKEPVGATRAVNVSLDHLQLDPETEAGDLTASVRLTRVEGGILADGRVRGTAGLECVRCLERFEAPFSGEFDADFRQTVDVRTGVELDRPEGDEIFFIDHNHELDLREILRQVAVLALPMQPICREDCPGILQIEDDEDAEEDAADDRFAALRKLLDESA